MTRLVLVRHGESNATVCRIIGGYRSCTGLSPHGRRQAEALRDRWIRHCEFTPDVVVSSQFRRAQETAEIVAVALGDPEITVDPGFGEHDPGPDCDGMSFADYNEHHAIGAEVWESGDPYAITFPGGETVAAFQYRVGSALWQTLADNEGATVMVFCHGGVVDAVMRLALKSPPTGSYEIHTLNTSITDLMLVKPNVWRVMRYNDVAHLADVSSDTPALVFP